MRFLFFLFLPFLLLAQSGNTEENVRLKGYVRVVNSNNYELDISSYGAVLSKSFNTEVQKGNVPGHSIVHKFGRNATVPSGSFELVSQLSAVTSFLSAATTVRVKAGGNVADDGNPIGSGAHTVIVEGLDNTGAFVSESIILEGTSVSSNTSTSFWRVFRMYVTGCGTYSASNTGTITLENSGGGTNIILILASEGQSQHGAYSIPLGKTGLLLGVKVQVDAAKAADFQLCIREDLTDTSSPVSPRRIKFYWDGVLGSDNLIGESPLLVLSALTDIWIEAQGGGAGTEVSVDFEILLVDD